MRRTGAFIGAIVVLTILWWAFPPFHIRSVKAIQAGQTGARFDAGNFITNFWQDKLLVAAEHATEASKVLEAIVLDSRKAREQFGRTVEIGGSCYFFMRGKGYVVSVDQDTIGIALGQASTPADISIPLGLVFGNALRDGTGLLNASDYPNSQQFNAIAAGLNQIAETQVLPKFQAAAKVGARVQFAGCAEVADDEHNSKPLRLVPILVKVE